MLLPAVCLGYTPDVHAAGASSYISSTYPANLSVKTTRVVNLMEFPSTSSTGKYTLPVDTMLTVKALHKNTSGTYWYEVLYYDMTLYIEAAAATLVDHLTGDVRVEDLFSPAALGLGQGFPIGGTITSSLNKLGTVTAPCITTPILPALRRSAPAIRLMGTLTSWIAVRWMLT